MGFNIHKHSHLHQRYANDERADVLHFLPPEEAAPLIPRYPSSGDNYGAAPGESAGGSSSSSDGSSSDGSSSSSSSPSSSTSSGSFADHLGGGTNVLAIALGVVIPVTFIIILMLVIWQVVKKRQRAEDLNDKHASLDFGLGEVSRNKMLAKGRKGRKAAPEMMDLQAEKEFRNARGMSMDMSSPYVLATDINEGRPSIQSLPRSAHDGDDPYGPSSMMRSNSPSGTHSRRSSRPPSRRDNASVWTESSDNTAHGMRSNLVRYAEKPSRDSPPTSSTGETPLLPSAHSTTSPADFSTSAYSVPRKPIGTAGEADTGIATHEPPIAPAAAGLGLYELPELTSSQANNDELDFGLPVLKTTSPVHEGTIPSFEFTEPSNDTQAPDVPQRSSLRPQPPTVTKHESLGEYDEYTTYADVLGIVQKETDPIPDEHGMGFDAYGLATSIRPLPPDDPEENPEARANRIRSFYREYFDDSKRDTKGYGYGEGDYYEDYGQEYLNDATVFDAETGQFVVGGVAPYAQHITRRAMTPPPRAPPRFKNGPGGDHRMYGSGQFAPGRRPRGYSTASGGPGFRGRAAKRPMPPPAPLTNLPTPHLLRDDSAIFNAADFAPPSTYKDRVAGRPDSPLMSSRPYSPPSVRAFTPLASSFDDLRAMPSPFALRKSGTFTGLDFAPPPRIHSETGSDAGSIRSGRSQMSASHLASMRAGAYRVSRIPKDQVGTRDDLAQALRPTWEQRGPQ